LAGKGGNAKLPADAAGKKKSFANTGGLGDAKNAKGQSQKKGGGY